MTAWDTRKAARLAAMAMALALCLPPAGMAQTLEEAGPLRSFPLERRPLPQPDIEQQAPATPTFVLPPLQPAPQPPLSDGLRIHVQAFRVVGNTVLDPARIEAVARPYLGREVTSQELQALRRELTLLYVDAGYVTSGVILPDQTVSDGIVTFRAIEGRLADVAVSGVQRLSPAYVRQALGLPLDTVVDLGTLQRRLQRLRLDPNIAGLNAELAPTERQGLSTLAIAVEEAPGLQWVAQFNNHRSPSIGPMQAEFDAVVRNPAGRGDALVLGLNRTRGLIDGSLGYRYPLSPTGPRLGLYYQAGRTEVVEAPFDALDIESDYDEWSAELQLPLQQGLQRDLGLTFSLDKRESTTYALGEPLSTVVEDGNSRVSVLRLAVDWVERRQDRVFGLRGTLSQGVDLFDATVRDDGPDGRFTALLLQAQYATRFGEHGDELVWRGDLQLTPDTLLPIEKSSLGGADSVRGYRENRLIADNGLVASVEWRSRLLRDRPELGTLQAAAFADLGIAWDSGPDAVQRTSIGSVGLGLRWRPDRHWFVDLYGALPLREFDQAENDLQDAGIHFAIGYRSH